MYRFIVLVAAGSALTSCAPSFGSGYASRSQEEQACAHIGIDPGSSAFLSCVDNLDSTLRQDASMDH